MPVQLAIDVGTTWTAAALARDGRVETVQLATRRQAVPSVVCLTDDGLLVGDAAARRAVSEPQRVAREFKRRVGDPTPLLLGGSPISAELCMARVARWVVDRVAATEGAPPGSLTLTHPANWGEYKLDLLRQALRHVDLQVDHLVPEPVAAAAEYAAERPLDPDAVVAVYDLGGGTFDAAVVRAGGPGAEATILGRPDGIERLGGIDFDHAVYEHVTRSLRLDLDAAADDPSLASGVARLREACVEAKEALSEDTAVSIPVMLPQLHTEVLLTRREFEAMIAPAIDETIVALRRAVTSAGIPEDQLAAVLLVGGSSRIPLVGQLVGARLGRPVAVDARPKDTICLGAARVAAAAVPNPTSAAPLRGLAAGTLLAGGQALATEPAGPGAASPATPSDGSSPPSWTPVPPGRAPGDSDAERSATARRRVGAVLAAVILVAVGVAATLLLVDGSGDGGGSASSTTEATPTSEATATTARSSTTSTDDDADANDEAAPLPGDDWNDEARAQFLRDCPVHLANEFAAAGTPVDQGCECMYDEAEADPAWTFASFNTAWVADAPGELSNEELSLLTSLMFQCMSIGA